MVRHCCLIKSLTSFLFLSNLSFLITKLEIYTMVFSFFSDKPKSTILLAIFFWIIVTFQFISPVVKYCFIRRRILKTAFKMVFHSICCCPRNASYGDSRFYPFIQSPTLYMFYNQITMYECFFFSWGILDLRSWLIFWFTLFLISCKFKLLSPVFGESYDVFSSFTFSWCRFGGNTTELILAGTQWFSVKDLMMIALVRFSFRR